MKTLDQIKELNICVGGMSGPPYIPDNVHGSTDFTVGNDKVTVAGNVYVGDNTQFTASYSNDYSGRNNEFNLVWHNEW